MGPPEPRQEATQALPMFVGGHSGCHCSCQERLSSRWTTRNVPRVVRCTHSPASPVQTQQGSSQTSSRILKKDTHSPPNAQCPSRRCQGPNAYVYTAFTQEAGVSLMSMCVCHLQMHTRGLGFVTMLVEAGLAGGGGSPPAPPATGVLSKT